MNQKNNYWILAGGIVLASIIFGIFFYSARNTAQTIRVVGYSNQEFEADIVKWSFSFSAMTPLNGQKQGYAEMSQKLETIKTILNSLNIILDEINIQPISIRKQYGQYGKIEGFILSQSIYVITKELEKIEKITVNPKEFAQKNIALESSNLEYFSTKLPSIKKKLLGAATKDALTRASEIANSAAAKIDQIQSARAGVFQITEPYTTEVSSYGMYQTSTRKKNIKVTVSAVFSIK
ncbi:MAG: SIMPL domain-containing protein [Candidatus Cloacimonadota bacterium]|nr:SIMPL domain-containing protein [Candidatus Cloacimonadota bacterium]